jgi:hypothetical protein
LRSGAEWRDESNAEEAIFAVNREVKKEEFHRFCGCWHGRQPSQLASDFGDLPSLGVIVPERKRQRRRAVAKKIIPRILPMNRGTNTGPAHGKSFMAEIWAETAAGPRTASQNQSHAHEKQLPWAQLQTQADAANEGEKSEAQDDPAYLVSGTTDYVSACKPSAEPICLARRIGSF